MLSTRWMKPEIKEKLRALVKKGETARMICTHLGIRDSQLKSQARIMGLKIMKEEPWNLTKVLRRK